MEAGRGGVVLGGGAWREGRGVGIGRPAGSVQGRGDVCGGGGAGGGAGGVHLGQRLQGLQPVRRVVVVERVQAVPGGRWDTCGRKRRAAAAVTPKFQTATTQRTAEGREPEPRDTPPHYVSDTTTGRLPLAAPVWAYQPDWLLGRHGRP